MSKCRADVLLYEKELANSRTHAQELIKSKKAYYMEGNKKVSIDKPSQELAKDLEIIIENDETISFVSRAGNKLYEALNELKAGGFIDSMSFRGHHFLDIGVSTGGFSDCVLKLGASQVFGIDVGHGQIAKNLLVRPNFRLFEGVNARYLSSYKEVTSQFPPEGFDYILMDVSFISIKLILNELSSFLKKNGRLLSLVKPQFELGAENLNRSGIVKNIDLYAKLEKDMMEFARTGQWEIIRYFASKVPGKDGNKEFFIFLKRGI
ncbi:MAG: TlyA family rRNA (cytidine-2'-O)-methyltransferase [Deltaproteobacteria bacterium]|jgi:23S rRNA (cytidine1920-2'-O)/16S rRNA (cytidine1409-2'-O)-methyltransferase|nr:TlyA family rRNA (cytidine-2'-O)-methyltransferase [Deltaproteobacteria bacterium]